VSLTGQALWRLVYEMELARPFLDKFQLHGMGYVKMNT